MSVDPDQRPQVSPSSGEHPLSVLIFAWTRAPKAFQLLGSALMIAAVCLVGVEIIISAQHIKDVTSIPGFQALFAFVAVGVATLGGWSWARLMRRPEDYYDRRSGEAGRDR